MNDPVDPNRRIKSVGVTVNPDTMKAALPVLEVMHTEVTRFSNDETKALEVCIDIIDEVLEKVGEATGKGRIDSEAT